MITGDDAKKWEQLRAQLESAQARAADQSPPSGESEARILRERAHELALAPNDEPDEKNLLDVVEFELAGERYGLELTAVREVCVLRELTPVPCTPAFVLGIINLRGEIHTVIDLKKFFELPDAGITELNKVLVLKAAGMRLGILADAIHGVRSISVGSLDPTLPTLTGIRSEFLRGVTSEQLIILDAAKILSDETIPVRESTET
jgi:purine-binding chemotaxis protein CheW